MIEARSWYTLQAALFLMVIGYIAKAFLYGTSYNSFFFMNCRIEETVARFLDCSMAVCLLVCTALSYMRASRWALIYVTLWVIGLAVFDFYYATWHPYLLPGSRLTRIALAVAVLLTWSYQANPRSLLWLLRIMIASTFFFHGWEAFFLRGDFLDMLIRVFGYDSNIDLLRHLLRVIAVIDLVVAFTVLLPLPRKYMYAVLLWMAMWGFLTAGARVFAVTWTNWPELMIRIPHGVVPLVLLFLWEKRNNMNDVNDRSEVSKEGSCISERTR